MALQVNDILNQVQTLLEDSSQVDRKRLLVWLNQVIKTIADMRDWDFLTTYTDLTITSGVVTLPADCKELINIQIGDTYYLDRNSLLTDSEHWQEYGTDSDTDVELPADSGTATVKYKVTLANYAYGDTTVFPDEFINALVDGVLCKYYQWRRLYDDLAVAKAQYQDDLSNIKKNYNRNQPVPKYDKHGYLRRR